MAPRALATGPKRALPGCWATLARLRVPPMRAPAMRAQGASRTLVVTVVGHSLGAVVAELAGYDIYDYLRAKGTQFHLRRLTFPRSHQGPMPVR